MAQKSAQGMTPRGLKAWARNNKSLAEVVLKATAFAQLERERVAAYILPVFERFSFVDDEGAPITDPEKLYLSHDEELCAEYYAACDTAHRENGFTGKEGFCPALMAESLQREAERALINSIGDFAGVGAKMGTMWDKALKLAMDACLCELK